MGFRSAGTTSPRNLLVAHHIQLKYVFLNKRSRNGFRISFIHFAIEFTFEITGMVLVRDDICNQPRPSASIAHAEVHYDRPVRLTVVLIYSGGASILNRLYYLLITASCCLFMLWCSKAIPTKLGQPCTEKQQMSAIALTDHLCYSRCLHMSLELLERSQSISSDVSGEMWQHVCCRLSS